MRAPPRPRKRTPPPTGLLLCACLVLGWLGWTLLQLFVAEDEADTVSASLFAVLQPPAQPDDAVTRAWHRNEILVAD